MPCAYISSRPLVTESEPGIGFRGSKHAACASTLLLLALLGGCDSDAKQEQTSSHALVAPEPQERGVAPVSAEQAHELADALVTAAYAGDAERVSALFDLRATVLRALGSGQEELSEENLRTLTAAVRRRFELAGLAYSLAQVAHDHSELRLLRETQAGEGRWLALRRNSAEGVEHLDFLLSLDELGKPLVVDTRSLSAGRLMSEQLREYELRVAVGQQVDDMALPLDNGLSAEENRLLAAHASQIRGAREANAMGRYPDGLGLWDRLPDAVRDLLPSRLFEFELALHARDRERYQRVFSELEDNYGDDAAVAMPRLKYHLAMEALPEALSAVDKVAQHAISDPYFDVIRSNILTDMHNPVAAKEAALRALQAAPDLKDAYWNLVAVSLNEQDFAATAELLLEMRDKFSLEYRLEKAPVFAQFVASPYYEKFLRGSLSDRSKPSPQTERRSPRATPPPRVAGNEVAKRKRQAPRDTAKVVVTRDHADGEVVQALPTGGAPSQRTVKPRTRGATSPTTGRVASQYTDAVQRMAAARVQGHARAQGDGPSNGKASNNASYEATNAVMNAALGTEF